MNFNPPMVTVLLDTFLVGANGMSGGSGQKIVTDRGDSIL
jgi:hypothetical protein